MDRPGPHLPPGRPVQLEGRGRTWVYDSAGAASEASMPSDGAPWTAPGARPEGSSAAGAIPAPAPATDPAGPAVLLLHGWTSTAALNWYRCFAPLAAEFRVLALDHRGHGRGVRSRRPFRLEDCADDAAALLTELGLGPVTVVGYSMGGAVAQLMWRRHPGLVDGLVLSATAARFSARSEFLGAFGTVGYAAALGLAAVPAGVRRQTLAWLLRGRAAEQGWAPWAVAESRRNDPAALAQAGFALGRFDSTSWIGSIDVPTAVIVTTEDVTVSPERQWHLAQTIPGAKAFPVAGSHRACADQARLYVPALVGACRAVQHAATASS